MTDDFNFSLRASAALAALVASLVALPSFAAIPRDLRVPGGVALIELGPSTIAKPSATFDGQRVWVSERAGKWMAVVGIPLAAKPGPHQIEFSSGGVTTTRSFAVRPKNYPVQTLTLDRAMVDPPPEVQARIERESAHLKTVRSAWRESSATLPSFVLPSDGPLSSRFGVARVLNGKPRSPHAGLDVAAPTGTPIHAPSDGIVLDTGDYYYCGKTVFLDHGNGLLTLYCHLSDISAKVGDTVKQGERIGAIGSTGRSTGPHLHWTVYLNGHAVEPELFLPTQKTAKPK